MAAGVVGGMLTKRELVGAEGSLWLSSVVMTCVIIYIDECGEFSGFSFRGWSKGQSGCRHCSAMKHKVCGVMDLF